MSDSNPTPQEQLTAYALNELDASERARIDAQLKNDATAQAYVNDVRATAALLETELKKERLDDLASAFGTAGAANPAAAQPAPAKIAPLAPRPTWKRFAIYGTAAAALVVFGVLIWSNQSRANAPQALRNADEELVTVSKMARPLAKNEEEKKADAETALDERTRAPDGLKMQGHSSRSTPDVKASKEPDVVASNNTKPTEKAIDASRGVVLNGGAGKNSGDKGDIIVVPSNQSGARAEDHFEFDADKSGKLKNVGGLVQRDEEKRHAESVEIPRSTTVTLPPVMPPTVLDKKLSPPVPADEAAAMKELREKMNSMETLPNEYSRPHSLSGLKAKDPSSKYDGDKNRDPNSAAQDIATPPVIKPLDTNLPPLKPLPPPVSLPKTENPNDTNANDAKVQGNYAVVDGGKFHNEAPDKLKNMFKNSDAAPPLPVQGGVDAPVFARPDKTVSPPPSPRLTIDDTDSGLAPSTPRGGRGNLGHKIDKKEDYPAAQENAKKKNDALKLDPNEEAAKPLNKVPAIGAMFEKPSRDKKPDPNFPESVTIPQPEVYSPYTPPTTGEAYNFYPENRFESVRNAPLSTFSADVDTASFSNVRRFLTGNHLPPPEAVRVEELINYFKYNYDVLKSEDPFGVNVEAAACPWNSAHRLVRVAIKASGLAANQRPASNLVFLIDVSGSMDDPKRLPLVKEGMKALVRRLNENDRVAIVTYAGQSGIALQSTSCSEKDRIIGVIDALHAEGETNGGAGIQTAYATAKANFIKGGVNRVILATDGDFNVGVTDPNELVKMIERETPSGVFLTALGYGMGNLKDAMLQRLADKGNGHYAYIDNADESRKVLIEQMNATLVAVAKDVKFQVEFNPAQAEWYRLIGYEKRALAAHDFNNDAKGAGEIGAGHTVTAFYEVVPTQGAPVPGVDKLKYQDSQPQRVETPATKPETASSELLTLKIRYKQPEGDTSKRLEFAFTDRGATLEQATSDFKFGASVALFGQILRHSRYVQSATMRQAVDLADDNRGVDEGGYRREFIQLARKAGELRGER